MKEFTFNAWIFFPKQTKKLKRPKGYGYIAITEKELLERGAVKEHVEPKKIKIIVKI